MIGETVFQSIDGTLSFIGLLLLVLIVMMGFALAILSRIARNMLKTDELIRKTGTQEIKNPAGATNPQHGQASRARTLID